MKEEAPEAKVKVIGFRWSPGAHEVKDFLARNRVPYNWSDVDDDENAALWVREEGIPFGDLPVVVFHDGERLTSPTDAEIAEKIGLSTTAEHPFYDLVVVGGGPAGLSAAIYGASEGLRTVVVEREAPGGQAGMSAAIENFFGFPEGLTGGELAQRAVEQARRFGVEIVAARAVVSLRAEEPYRVVRLDDGAEVYCHTVLLSPGVSWRVLEAPGCRTLVGRGVYYGAAAAEAALCRDQDVYLIGGGNSAGQAAVLLAQYARSVTLLAPEPDFAERMSEYLLERLEGTEKVSFRPGVKVCNAEGSERLESITLENVQTGDTETVPTSALFVFIGATPETEWLDGIVKRDENGFVVTGPSAADGWALKRAPLPLESSLPGVFVAGDVRSESVKRVGAAVGEGAMAISAIHEYLRDR